MSHRPGKRSAFSFPAEPYDKSLAEDRSEAMHNPSATRALA
jgi:hypothetical protein